jgi:ubiquinone/menaquinone biosynthesis C-methylase UbiE
MSAESVSFDRAAEYYDETRGFPPGQEQPVAALMAQAGGLNATSRVLEIGIGTGRIALPLALHVGDMVGVDLSRPMLNRLRAKQTTEPVEVTVGDATQLPFPAGSFDAVVAVHIFHLIGNWQGALSEVARVLRPDGVLVSGWNNNTSDQSADVLWNAWNAIVQEESRPHVGVAWDQFETFLPDAGWQRAGDTLTHTFITRRTPQEFLSLLERRAWSRCWRMPDDLVERGIAAVREAIRQHGIDPQQPQEHEAAFKAQAFRRPA